jgi:hypothetical protein
LGEEIDVIALGLVSSDENEREVYGRTRGLASPLLRFRASETPPVLWAWSPSWVLHLYAHVEDQEVGIRAVPRDPRPGVVNYDGRIIWRTRMSPSTKSPRP